MKNNLLQMMLLTTFFGLFGCKTSTDPSTWNSKQIDKWFEKKEWLNGWKILPDASINRKEFAVSYYKNKERWDKAFAFLKSSDLSKLELKRHDIDGDNLYAPVSEYITRDDEGAKFEVHKKYIDVQYIISGKEKMLIAPLNLKKEALVPYDSVNDYELMYVSESTVLKATPDRFFIFFPDDAHSPGLKDGENSPVRKVVVKVKVE